MPQPDPVKSSRLWIVTWASVALLLFGIVFGFVLYPPLRAHSSAKKLRQLGFEFHDWDYSCTSDPGKFLGITYGEHAINATCIQREPGVSPKLHSKIQDSDLLHCRSFPRLMALDLTNGAVTSQGLQFIPETHLMLLILSGTRVGSGCPTTGATSPGLQPLAKFKQLDWLQLNHTCVVDDDLKVLAGLPELQDLGLNHTKITTGGVAHLSKLMKLRDLDLSYTDIDDGVVRHLIPCRTLFALDLSGTKVTGRGVERFGSCFKLSLEKAALNEEGLRSIGNMKNLINLDISNTNVTRSSLQNLQSSQRLSNLRLRGRQFNDEHLQSIATLKLIQTLDLSNSSITAVGIRLLEQIPQLHYLTLDSDQALNPAFGEALGHLKQLRALTVIVDPSRPFNPAPLQKQLGKGVTINTAEQQARF